MVLFKLNYTNTHCTKGFTLLELILVVAIAAMVATWSVTSIVRYGANKEIDIAVTEIVSLVNETRQRTVAAETDTQFGIMFATSTVTRFEGSVFDASSSTTNTDLNVGAVTLEVDFSDGSDQVIFSRLRGMASATGTVTVLHPRSGRSVELEILQTGNIVRP